MLTIDTVRGGEGMMRRNLSAVLAVSLMFFGPPQHEKTAGASTARDGNAHSSAELQALEIERRKLPANKENAQALSAILRKLSAFYADVGTVDFEKAREASLEDVSLNARFDKNALPESWLLLGDVERRSGNYSVAQNWIERAVTELEKRQPPDPKRLSAAFNYLALLNNSAGDFAQSETNARRALAYGKEAGLSEELMAMHSVVLANALRQQGKYQEALPVLQQTLPILGKSDNKPLFAAATNNLGALYFWLGDYQKALAMLNEGLKLRQQLSPTRNLDIANSLQDLGCTEIKLGQLELATRHLSKAMSIRKSQLGIAHPETLSSISALAVCYESAGESLQAAKLLDQAVTHGKAVLGAGNPDLAHYQDNYANILASLKMFDKARNIQTESLATRKKVFGADSREYAAGLRTLAQIESEAGNAGRAGALLQQSAAIYKAAGQVPDQDYADTLDELTQHFVNKGDLNAAHATALDAVSARAPGGPTVAYAVSLANLATLEDKLNRQEERRAHLSKAKAVIESLPDDQRTNPDCTAVLMMFSKLPDMGN
jgi:tetratricopeptide (TPR) repeat protein